MSLKNDSLSQKLLSFSIPATCTYLYEENNATFITLFEILWNKRNVQSGPSAATISLTGGGGGSPAVSLKKIMLLEKKSARVYMLQK